MARRRQSHKDFSDLTDMRADLYCRVSKIVGSGEQEVDEKSVDDQEREGIAWAERTGVRLQETFRDPGLSASRFATKDRPEFKRLLDHVRSDEVDIVWVWAVDRSQRDLRVFGELREVFQRHQVALSVNGRLHDPSDYDAWMLLGITSFFGERYSEELSKNVSRGVRSSAFAGQPPGPLPYGYRRRKAETRPAGVPDEQVWIHKKSKTFAWQEPNTWDGDGNTVEDSPAAIVREIFNRIEAGDTLRSIRLDFADRGISSPSGKKWWDATGVRMIAMNPAYIARRVHQGNVLEDVAAKWSPLVDEGLFWAVRQILTDEKRKTTRPSRARYLLSNIIRCAECGEQAIGKAGRGRGYPAKYECRHRSCMGVNMGEMDAFVEDVVIRWGSDPDKFAALNANAANDSAAAAQARRDVERARAQLQQLYADVKAGTVSATIATLDETRIAAAIADAERRMQDATVPPVLRGRIGRPDFKAEWEDEEITPLEVKRQIITALADIRVRPVGRGHRIAPHYRVEWKWLYGPDAGQVILPPERSYAASPNEARVLLVLADHQGPLPQKDVASLLGIWRGNAAKALRRLVDRGLVSRWVDGVCIDGQDARRGGTLSPELTLTDEGRQVAATLDGAG